MRTLIVGFTDAEVAVSNQEHRRFHRTIKGLVAAIRHDLAAPLVEWLEDNASGYEVGELTPGAWNFNRTIIPVDPNVSLCIPITITDDADAVAFSLVFADRIVTP